MTEPMPSERLAGIDGRLDALALHAPPGVWRYDGGGTVSVVSPGGAARMVAAVWSKPRSDTERALGEFIAHARQDVPDLRAEVDRLCRAVELLGRSAQSDSQDIIDACRDLIRVRQDIADAEREAAAGAGDPAEILRELAARHAPAEGVGE